MNRFFVLIFLLVFLNADILSDFQKHNYFQVCKLDNITYTKDEKLLSIIGISCVKSDKLFLLPYVIAKLKFSKTARKNAIYLNTIYMQKRLLYSYFFDNFSLDGFDLPNTNYIISIVFNKIKNNDYKKEGNVYIIQNKNELIKVYPKNTRLYIDEYINGKLIKRHWFK